MYSMMKKPSISVENQKRKPAKSLNQKPLNIVKHSREKTSNYFEKLSSINEKSPNYVGWLERKSTL